MGRPEMGGKHKNLVTQVAAAFVGPIRARLTTAGLEILSAWSSGRPPPPWLERLQCWLLESAPTAETRSA